MTAAAFQATFADFKLVKSRNVAQIVVEVPLEAADNALAMLGGLPRPDSERWVAVARLNSSPGAPREAETVSPATAAPPPPQEPRGAPGEQKERRPFNTLPLPQQVALRCNDEKFRAWLGSLIGLSNLDADDAADMVRDRCEVASRSQILPGTDAAKRWAYIEGEYLAFTGQLAEERS